MATKTKRKKKGSGAVWTAIYVVILVLWILFLAACCMYVLKEVWNYASVYDQTQIDRGVLRPAPDEHVE